MVGIERDLLYFRENSFVISFSPALSLPVLNAWNRPMLFGLVDFTHEGYWFLER